MSYETIETVNGTYEPRFVSEFKDRFNKTIKVEIYQMGYVGTVDNISILHRTLVISNNQQEIGEGYIQGTGCKFTVVNTSENFLFFNELYGQGRYKNYVIVKRIDGVTTEYLFEGYIIPNIYNQNIKTNARVEITASNQLKQLSDVEPNFLAEIQQTVVTGDAECLVRLKLPYLGNDTTKDCTLSVDFDFDKSGSVASKEFIINVNYRDIVQADVDTAVTNWNLSKPLNIEISEAVTYNYIRQGATLGNVYVILTMQTDADFEITGHTFNNFITDIQLPNPSATFTYEEFQPTGVWDSGADEDLYIHIIDLIKECIWAGTNIVQPIWICNTIYNNLQADFDLTKTIYDELYLDKNLFYNDEDKMNCYDTLEMILKSTGSILFWYDRKWVIQRLKDVKEESDYKVYNINNTTGVGVLTNTVHQLQDLNKLMDANNVSFIAGQGRYELDLNVKYQENAVVNHFEDISTDVGYNIQTQYHNIRYLENNIWINASGNRDLPVIKGRRFNWYFNNQIMRVINPTYSDVNVDNGVEIGWDRGGSIIPPITLPVNTHNNHPQLFVLSTPVIIDYKIGQKLNISYNISQIKGLGLPNIQDAQYSARFAVRYWDEVQEQFNYLEEFEIPNGGTGIATSTSYKYIRNISDVSDVGKRGGNFEINKTLDLSLPIDTIQPNGSLVQLWIDFYLLEFRMNEDDYWKPMPFNTIFGDFNITSDSRLGDNNYEVELETLPNQTKNYNKKNLFLDIYDYSTVSAANTTVLKIDGEFLPAKLWKEKRGGGRLNLQSIYLADIIQQYNNNRYKLDIDIIPNSSTYIKNNDLFQFNALGNRYFLPIGKSLNVENGSYRINLQEYVDDDGYYLLDGVGILPENEILEVTPVYIQDNGTANNGNGEINLELVSNTHWFISNITTDFSPSGYNDWYIVTPQEGFEDRNVSIIIQPFYQSAWGTTVYERNLQITFSTYGGSTKIVDLKQLLFNDL